MQRIIVNCQTGEQTVVELTQDEIDALPIPIPPTLLEQIATLEAQITPRRIREALLGDSSFITNIEAQIAELRGQL